MADRRPSPAEIPAPPARSSPSPDWNSTPREGEYYFDGPYMVFTAAYHLRRGSCCQSGCRHCPWEFKRTDQAQASP